LAAPAVSFAFQALGVTPDNRRHAKPIAAGLPLGAFLAKEEFASAISAGQHGTTFGGGPLACRVALEYLAIVEEENLLANVTKVGAYLTQQLQQLVEDYAAAKEVRGRGFIQGIDLEIPSRRSSSKASPKVFYSIAPGHRGALPAAVPARGTTRGQGYPRAPQVPGKKRRRAA